MDHVRITEPYEPYRTSKGKMVHPLWDVLMESISHINEPDVCWEWQRPRDKNGYASISVGGKKYLVHRLIYRLVYGEWANICRHTCDNPPCCNPSHLVNGDRADNMRDMVERERHAWSKRNTCKLGHPLSPFYGQRRCLICSKAYGQAYYQRNKERLAERRRQRNKNERLAVRETRLLTALRG